MCAPLSRQELRKKATPLDKYVYIQGIQNLDERLYYALLTKHTAEVRGAAILVPA